LKTAEISTEQPVASDRYGRGFQRDDIFCVITSELENSFYW
jgi:hypothetical protein